MYEILPDACAEVIFFIVSYQFWNVIGNNVYVKKKDLVQKFRYSGNCNVLMFLESLFSRNYDYQLYRRISSKIPISQMSASNLYKSFEIIWMATFVAGSSTHNMKNKSTIIVIKELLRFSYLLFIQINTLTGSQQPAS